MFIPGNTTDKATLARVKDEHRHICWQKKEKRRKKKQFQNSKAKKKPLVSALFLQDPTVFYCVSKCAGCADRACPDLWGAGGGNLPRLADWEGSVPFFSSHHFWLEFGLLFGLLFFISKLFFPGSDQFIAQAKLFSCFSPAFRKCF